MFCFNFSITTIELALISIMFTSLLYPLCNLLAGAFTLKFDNKYAIFTCAVLTLFTFLLHWLATSCFNLLSSMKYKLLPYFDLFLAFFFLFQIYTLTNKLGFKLRMRFCFSVCVCVCVLFLFLCLHPSATVLLRFCCFSFSWWMRLIFVFFSEL